VEKWIELEDITLNEINQTQKNMTYILICRSLKIDLKEKENRTVITRG
jgi:hypothetical protein